MRRTALISLLLLTFCAAGFIAREATFMEELPNFSVSHTAPLLYPLVTLPALQALFLP